MELKELHIEPDLPKIRTISEIFQTDFIVPVYQRPYRWKASMHVRQLFDDIERELNKGTIEYRLGTLIFHEANIVDGQQRLVTLTLLLKILGYEGDLSLLDQEFSHVDSKNNIKYNYLYLQHLFRSYSMAKKEQIKNFILNHCTSVVITLHNVSEAFQLFDSQNARGRSLEPADLLKAFHLREMQNNTASEKRLCVKLWEKAIDDGVLNDVIGKYLFRIRRWKRKEWDYYFTKDEIKEFKGISLIQTLREGKLYPYVLILIQNSQSLNFQIDEPIVNGIRFFRYVDHYVQMHHELKLYQLNTSFHGLNFSYNGWYRIGDRRIKTAFLNVLMVYMDKFGKDEYFVEFSRDLFRWAYSTRLKQTQIRYQTILNLLKEDKNNPIKRIESWYYPEIQQFRLSIPLLKDINRIKPNPEIENCITSLENAWGK